MENPQWWQKPRQPTGCRIHYKRGIQCRTKTQRQRPLVLFFSHTRRRLQDGGNDLSLSHALLHALYNVSTIYINNMENMCPKSYLYIYDFSAYLHMCPSNQSEPIGAGSEISRFSASSIRRDMFPNSNIRSWVRVLPYNDILWLPL